MTSIIVYAPHVCRTFNGDIEYLENKDKISKLIEEDKVVLFFNNMSKIH